VIEVVEALAVDAGIIGCARAMVTAAAIQRVEALAPSTQEKCDE